MDSQEPHRNHSSNRLIIIKITPAYNLFNILDTVEGSVISKWGGSKKFGAPKTIKNVFFSLNMWMYYPYFPVEDIFLFCFEI